MKPTIYIAGKITGLPINQVYADFKAEENKLRAKGYETINPLDLCDDLQYITDKDEQWQRCMKRCLSTIEYWNGIYLLPTWDDKSKGALIEKQLCENLNIPLYYHISDLKDLLFEDSIKISVIDK